MEITWAGGGLALFIIALAAMTTCSTVTDIHDHVAAHFPTIHQSPEEAGIEAE